MTTTITSTASTGHVLPCPQCEEKTRHYRRVKNGQEIFTCAECGNEQVYFLADPKVQVPA